MAVRKWLHIYNMVSIGSHQFGEHRAGEALSVLVSNYYALSLSRAVFVLLTGRLASVGPQMTALLKTKANGCRYRRWHRNFWQFLVSSWSVTNSRRKCIPMCVYKQLELPGGKTNTTKKPNIALGQLCYNLQLYIAQLPNSILFVQLAHPRQVIERETKSNFQHFFTGAPQRSNAFGGERRELSLLFRCELHTVLSSVSFGF